MTYEDSDEFAYYSYLLQTEPEDDDLSEHCKASIAIAKNAAVNILKSRCNIDDNLSAETILLACNSEDTLCKTAASAIILIDRITDKLAKCKTAEEKSIIEYTAYNSFSLGITTQRINPHIVDGMNKAVEYERDKNRRMLGAEIAAKNKRKWYIVVVKRFLEHFQNLKFSMNSDQYYIAVSERWPENIRYSSAVAKTLVDICYDAKVRQDEEPIESLLRGESLP